MHSTVVNIAQQAGSMKNVIELLIGPGVRAAGDHLDLPPQLDE